MEAHGMPSEEQSFPPYVLTELGIQRRVLAWIDPNVDRIGNTLWPRNTAAGLTAHLSDDPNTIGNTSVESVVGYLRELTEAGLVRFDSADGTYTRTAEGTAALGGVIYAQEEEAGRLVHMPDGTWTTPEAAKQVPVAPSE